MFCAMAWCWLSLPLQQVLEISHHCSPLCDYGSRNKRLSHWKGQVDQTPLTANDHHLWKCGICTESACTVIKNAVLDVVAGHMWCPHFHSPLLNKAAPNDLFTPTPLSFPFCVDWALTIAKGPGREPACSVWWSVSLREILTANHLSSSGVLLGFTFQEGSISYIPARRAVSC